MTKKLFAIHCGHVDIAENYVNPLPAQTIQCLDTVRCLETGGQFEPGKIDHPPHECSHRRRIVDDQDSVCHWDAPFLGHAGESSCSRPDSCTTNLPVPISKLTFRELAPPIASRCS